MEYTLKQMIHFAEKQGGDVNKVYDLWNTDKNKLFRLFDEAKTKKLQDMGIQDAKENFFQPPQTEFVDATQILRMILDSLKPSIKTEVTDTDVRVAVTITSDMFDHTEETHLIFDNTGKGAQDEGIQAGIQATISELCYEYLINL